MLNRVKQWNMKGYYYYQSYYGQYYYSSDPALRSSNGHGPHTNGKVPAEVANEQSKSKVAGD